MDADGSAKPQFSNKKKQKPENESMQITYSEFLSFLKTAYQVQDIGQDVILPGGMKEAVQWLKAKEQEIAELALKPKEIACQTSNSLIAGGGSGDNKINTSNRKKGVMYSSSDSEVLKKTLNDVLSEGILDSVLPYLVQNANTALKKTTSLMKITDKSHLQGNCSPQVDILSRKSSESNEKLTEMFKTDSEVEIHVCDEVKNMKKTFVCNQNLLVEKMGYFAEVTKGQKLEDMDISVHCDVGIFEWLMQWVKKDSLLEADWPQLDPQCVVPILVSAAFLQMEPLLHDCLLFCHQHMNEIVRSSTNLLCLNDSVITRLAAMYTNTEVEAIKDRKDKIQSRLFAKLIESLAEPEAESVRGHWCSLAKLFRCEKCQQLITPTVASKTPCVPVCMRLQPDGSIISLHVRDETWNINEHILTLQKSLKTWRKVYWRLWGDAHFLYCIACKRYFPANQIGCCRYHPEPPQFFTLDAQKAPLPIGRYPCCGERAYRFQLLEDFSGCQFRQHTVSTDDVKDCAIYNMLENYQALIEEEPPQLLFPERLTRLVARDPTNNDNKFVCKESFWWDGFEIIPPRPEMGLLTKFANRRFSDDKTESVVSEESIEESEESSSLTSLESESSNGKKESKKKEEPDLKIGNLWQHNLSVRRNQDIQRSYEENILKEMQAIIYKRTLNDPNNRNSKLPLRAVTPIGGIWMRLEQDWKDSSTHSTQIHKQKNPITPSKISKLRGKF